MILSRSSTSSKSKGSSSHKKSASTLSLKNYKRYYADKQHDDLCDTIQRYLDIKKNAKVIKESVAITDYINMDVTYNTYNQRYIMPYFVSSLTNPVDAEWLRAQNKYMLDLDDDKIDVIRDWSQCGYKRLKFDKEFDKLFSGVPLSDKPIYLYRSDKNPQAYANDPDYKKHAISKKDEGRYKRSMMNLSYTMSYDVAVDWVGDYITRMKVMPNIPMLMITELSENQEEFEVIVPRGVIYYVKSAYEEVSIPYGPREEVLCPSEVDTFKTVYITDLVVVGYYNANILSTPGSRSEVSRLSQRVIDTMKNKLDRIRRKRYIDDIYLDYEHLETCKEMQRLREYLSTIELVKRDVTLVSYSSKKKNNIVTYLNVVYNHAKKYYMVGNAFYSKINPIDKKYFYNAYEFISNAAMRKNAAFEEYVKTDDPDSLSPLFDEAPVMGNPMFLFGSDIFWTEQTTKDGIVTNKKVIALSYDVDRLDTMRYRVLVPKSTQLIIIDNKAMVNKDSRFYVKETGKTFSILKKRYVKRYTEEVDKADMYDMVCPHKAIDKTITIIDLILLVE